MKWLLAEFLLLLHAAFSSCESCDHRIHSCPEGQICSTTTGKCECPKGTIKYGDQCSSDDDHGAGHVATVTILVLLAILVMIVGFALIVRRYQLMDWLRQRIEARRNRDVLYEDVMIGQDDPPLAL